MLIPPSVVRDEGVCNLGPSALEQLTGIAAAPLTWSTFTGVWCWQAAPACWS